jgi:hypothetical protein
VIGGLGARGINEGVDGGNNAGDGVVGRVGAYQHHWKQTGIRRDCSGRDEHSEGVSIDSRSRCRQCLQMAIALPLTMITESVGRRVVTLRPS